jgi:hypothetical protein
VSATADLPTSGARLGRESGVYTRDEVFKLLTNATDERAARHALSRDDDCAGYALVPAAELLEVRAPSEYVIDGLIERGISVGLVGPPESGKSLLAAHWLACVATGQHFHGRAVRLGLAVWLCGEGHRGIARRLQALELYYRLPLRDAALVVSQMPASLVDPLQLLTVRAAIERAQDRFGLGLELLVVDTVARFMAPADESVARDMGAMLDAVDRLRGSATAVLNHHPGHGDNRRARGSSAWRGALDAEYTIEATGDAITLSCVKLKDGEKPPPLGFRLQTSPTRCARADGTPWDSVVLAATDAPPPASAAVEARGKAQRQLLVALRAHAASGKGVWTLADIREVGRLAGMHRNSARSAAEALTFTPRLTATVGGYRLAEP